MKKLFAILLSILTVLLIFASCDTGGEDVSSDPVSEVSSAEVSSKAEEESSAENEAASFTRHYDAPPTDMALSYADAETLVWQYFKDKDKFPNFPAECLIEPSGWLEKTNADGSKNFYYGIHLYTNGGTGEDMRAFTFAWLWVDMNDGSLWEDIVSHHGLPVLDY
ncbi:MAG: hypothetical protein IJC85_01370 [Oscillospiraceae bacterium]|nr:hypothetical protein [Oscillospiraceae bacterium]